MTPPSKINLNKAKTVLTVTFDDIDYELTSEFLRSLLTLCRGSWTWSRTRNPSGWKGRCNHH